MKIRISLTRAKILMFGGLFFLVAALPLTVWFVQQQQNLQQEAAGAPTLSLVPASVPSAKVGESFDLSVELRPGKNRTIKEVKFVVEYDPEKLDPTGGFENQSGLEELPQAQEFVEGRIKVALGTDDATKFIKEKKRLGALTFTALSDTGGDKTAVRFVRGESQVIGVKNEFTPDVVNSDVIIGEGERICPAEGKGECSWSPALNATKYHYVITRDKGDGTLEEIADNFTTDTKVTFDAIPGGKYSCQVIPFNDCGFGGEGEDSATCQPEITPSPSPSPSPSVTPTNTPTPTKTPTPSPTKTPTPTPTLTVTPTPTTVVNIPTPTPTIIVQGPPPESKGGAPPQPTLPPTGTGDTITAVGAFVGTALLLLGGILFFIF